ncbi:unnamed protein product [Chilo suppressalis]|uniref:Uncharacterized protein n=1 Tax=Chilo suppressalis TaxID=168631 RepID=A0ABN8L6S8_CHISP|nr:unnamed protein product [Chilo suppressalis]
MKPADLSEECAPLTSMNVIRSNSNTSFPGSKSNPSGSREHFSIFSETACGEPSTTQHLILDFTPVEEEDNEFVQNKCCSFWEFINSKKDLQKFMVLPELNEYSLPMSEEPPNKEIIEDKTPLKESTAVSMLGFVEEKGLIDRTFEAKLPKSLCSLGSREYHDNRQGLKKTSPYTDSAQNKKGAWKSYEKRQPASGVRDTSSEAKILMREMHEWDRRHPCTMDPPGHLPALSYCVLQRKLLNQR